MPRASAPWLAALAVGAAIGASACAPVDPGAPGIPAVRDDAFRASDFAWSTADGRNSIDGRVDYRPNGVAHRCAGSVGLVPDTPYTRSRFRVLYGSTDRAAVPADVVRARNVPDPAGDYTSYTRSAPCTDGRFAFSGLPDGGWFVIAPAAAPDGSVIVLMRRVATRGGTMTVTLP